jgi:hypothetical protein
MHRRDEKSIQILVVKPEEERPLERSRYRWGNNASINPRDVGFMWLRIGTSVVLLGIW